MYHSTKAGYANSKRFVLGGFKMAHALNPNPHFQSEDTGTVSESRFEKHVFTDQVVIIDDDRDDLEIITHFFKSMNDKQKLTSYKNSSRFIEDMNVSFNQWNEQDGIGVPRLIILDMHMPGLDGIDVLKTIKSNPAWMHVPLILVTGVTDDEKITKAYELGASAFIPKPFSMMDLVQAIHQSYH